ncbi:MAG: glycosyltransferase family 9 protein [bacterium]
MRTKRKMIQMRSRWKRAVAIIVDGIVGALAPLLVNRSLSADIPTSPRVLVIRCDHIGDAAMATAVLGPLRRALQPSTLDVLTSPWASAVFDDHPDVDNVIAFSTPWWSAARGASLTHRMQQWTRLPALIRTIRAGRYDVGIDLRGDLRHITFFLALGGMRVRVSSDRTGGRPLLTHAWPFDASLHEVEKNVASASLVGAKPPMPLNIATGHTLSEKLTSLLSGHGFENGYVAFTLRGSAFKRSWPAEHARAVAELLRARLGIGSVYVGGGAEQAFGTPLSDGDETGIVNLSGQTSLAEAIAVLRGAAVTVAVDSGPMHLAAGVSSPIVALFGPSDPAIFRPWSAHTRIVGAEAPCGCRLEACDFAPGAGACMRRIAPERVFDAIRELLDEQRVAAG